MEREATNRQACIETGMPRYRRALLQGGFFILVWPSFILLFVSFVLLELGYFDEHVMGSIALRLYGIFALAYGLILLFQWLFPASLSEEKFWPQLGLHVGVIFVAAQFFGPVLTQANVAQLPRPSAIPVVFMLVQIALYVAVKTLIVQRERHLATQLNLRQARINALQAQSNPHFLFNTLNLLASEIGRNPATAREIVYDLADLLRESMRAAEHEFISLDEEVQLATLYLTLQQKRFPERLAFEIDIENRCRRLPVPSLLLQPVVENVVKHVVARSTDMTLLRLSAHATDNSLVIRVQDNGRRIDSGSLEPRGGLRILRETLALQYHGQADMVFESSGAGGRLEISLPLRQSLADG